MAVKTNEMPYNLEAEQSVLGCILIDQSLQSEILSQCDESDFYRESHKLIINGMKSVFNDNKPVDLVTLTDQMEKEGTLEQAGGITYLTGLARITPSAANYRQYTDIVKRDGVFRKLIRSSGLISEYTRKSSGKEDAIAFAEKQIYDISASVDNSNLTSLGPVFEEVIDKFNAIHQDKDAFKGLSTGFTRLDEITNGLQRTDLILIAARPAMGKTSLAMNLVENCAVKGKAVCAVFSLEMPRVQIAQRLLCSLSGVNMADALKGNLQKDDWKKLWEASKQLNEAKIFVDDSSLVTPVDMLSKCRRLKAKHGLDLVMVDYIQLMSGNKSTDSRQQEISEITRNLKILAKEINVPVIALSQLSRAVESRTSHRPQLSDLRESGAIEQDADIVMFIHRPDLVISEKEINTGAVEKNVAEIIIAKHRNGPTDTFKLYFKGESTKFMNISEGYVPEEPEYMKKKAEAVYDEPVGSLESLTPPPEEEEIF